MIVDADYGLLATALAAGFFGSAHCIGMCGPVVVMLEGAGGAPRPRTWPRRIAYQLGRLGFYVLLGAIAAGGGAWFAGVVPGGFAWLRVIAAALVIAIGLQLAFDLALLGRLESAGAGIWRRLRPLSRYVLPVSTLPRAFGAGLLWGALPCGLVYSAVALAATGGGALAGGMAMTAFWLGTLPALLAAGRAAQSLDRWRREPRVRRVAGVLLAAMGIVGLAMPLLHAGGAPGTAGGHDGAGHAQETQPGAGRSSLLLPTDTCGIRSAARRRRSAVAGT